MKVLDVILTRAFSFSLSLSTHKTHTLKRRTYIFLLFFQCKNTYIYNAHLMMYQVNGGDDEVDAQVVTEAVLEAIKNWSEISEK